MCSRAPHARRVRRPGTAATPDVLTGNTYGCPYSGGYLSAATYSGGSGCQPPRRAGVSDPKVKINDVCVAEGNSGYKSMTFTLTRFGTRSPA